MVQTMTSERVSGGTICWGPEADALPFQLGLMPTNSDSHVGYSGIRVLHHHCRRPSPSVTHTDEDRAIMT
jgi:hypothetical protein